MGPLHQAITATAADSSTAAQADQQQYVPGGTQPHAQRKILCLGMSYAELRKFAHKELVTVDDGTSEMHVRRVIECVRRGYLTEMDGRDLVRVVATEYEVSANIYTVSQEEGACYRQDRHMNGNFNRTHFVRRLQEHFLCQEFDQVILDYFWIPAGWDLEHWSRSLFSNTLIELARQDVLPYREPRPGELLGSVILPFCYHCFKEVIGNFKHMRRYYDVSFLRKHELEKVPLWRGTQQVGAKAMQYWLGKRRDQEEVYCTFGPRDVNEAGKDTTVSKQKIVQLARQLEDFADIRFIVLTRLAPTRKGERKRKGQWKGLTPKDKVCRGYDSLGNMGRQAPPPPPHHEEEKASGEQWKRSGTENVRHNLPFKKRRMFRMTPSCPQITLETVLEPGSTDSTTASETGTVSSASSFENHDDPNAGSVSL